MLFGKYDIRGKWQKEITPEFALNLGRALVIFKKKKSPKILINFDTRFSSPILARSLKKGILEEGGKVIFGGRTSTPFHYFLSQKIKPDLSVMITASHNPIEWNGFIILDKEGFIYSENGLEKIQEIINSLKFSPKKKIDFSKVKKIDLKKWQERYFSYLEKQSSFEKGFWQKNKFVFDFLKGSASLVSKKFLERKRVKNFIFLNEKIDPLFSSVLPDPFEKKSQKKIKKTITKEKCLGGAIFDGDGDRIVFFNQKGKIIPSRKIAQLLIEEFFSKEKGIVCEVSSGLSFFNFLKERKMKIIFSKVGHSFVYFTLKKTKANFGFESSGHFYYSSFWNFDNPEITILKVLKIISSKPEKWLSLSLKKDPFKREEINFRGENYWQKFETIKEKIVKKFAKRKGNFSFLDGISFFSQDIWFNLRQSKTTPILRLKIEARKEKELKEIKKLLISLIREETL